jgi:uncharacterized protein with HEPN domain
MSEHDQLYRKKLLEAIDKINQYVAGVERDEFLANPEKQSAVILQLILIGEVSKRFSESFKQTYPLPWREIAGFRDRAVHHYFSLDLESVWETIQTDLPELKSALATENS